LGVKLSLSCKGNNIDKQVVFQDRLLTMICGTKKGKSNMILEKITL